MSELKECPSCGGNNKHTYGYVRCACGVEAPSAWQWNRRAMPKCVRELVETASGCKNCYELAKAVRAYYGEEP